MFVSSKFSQLALDILELAYDTDQKKAALSLIKKVDEFDNITCMQAATAFNNLEIIAHPCFDNIVVKVWYHKIIPDTNKFYVDI